jgi:hypothetical protein
MNDIKSDVRNSLENENGADYVAFKTTIYKLSIRELCKNT